MNKKKLLIPELRFPEFTNEGEWNECELGELCDYWNGASHENGVNDNGEYYLISLNSIDIEGNLKREMKRLSYTDNSLQKNDLVMVLSDVAHGNFLGLTDIIPNEKYVLNQRMAGLRVKDIKQSIPLFIRTYINKNQKYFKSKGQGSSQLNLSKSSVTEFPVKVPKSSKEQQKIASCLSSLDEVIEAHSQKLEVLKDHKKGLMQNLFPQEGEKVPKYRFKEFKKDGEWVEKNLGDKEVAFIVNEKTSISKLNIETYISTENMLPDFTGVSAASKLPPTGSYTKFKIGDILISNIRPYLKKVWKSDKIGGASNDVIVFRSGSGVLSEFLEFIIKNEAFINYIMESAKGVKMPRGDKDSMLNYIVFIPTKEEQQKVASCLSSLDEIIKAQSEKIEQLKQHKKGLMQGLFPKINDI